ncbi:hypothetical protein ABT120_59605 [Nonomuraea angiospora]|uniref:hypothetical protein n=1 Tax=Nonomuraea angiospora TaxID=46172 RepID=UPI00332536D0
MPRSVTMIRGPRYTPAPIARGRWVETAIVRRHSVVPVARSRPIRAWAATSGVPRDTTSVSAAIHTPVTGAAGAGPAGTVRRSSPVRGSWIRTVPCWVAMATARSDTA